jgi:hypothetical protein
MAKPVDPDLVAHASETVAAAIRSKADKTRSLIFKSLEASVSIRTEFNTAGVRVSLVQPNGRSNVLVEAKHEVEATNKSFVATERLPSLA